MSCPASLNRTRKQELSPFRTIIYWSEDDDTFIAEVPELPGCMADGATKAEALAAGEEAAAVWVETARKLGRKIPEPRARLMFA